MPEKRGRPPSKDPKTLNTRIRLSETDVAKLERCCGALRITKAEAIRRGLDLLCGEIEAGCRRKGEGQ